METAIVQKLLEHYPILIGLEKEILEAYNILKRCFENQGKVLIAGNGGSCSDAEHIVGELMKGFQKEREINQQLKNKLCMVDSLMGTELSTKLQEGLPAIALTGHAALSTAYLNDVDGNLIFAQQICGYGVPQDVFWGISTSGNSKNILYAAVTAKAIGMKVIALTGKDGGKLREFSDVSIIVPEEETYRIQEIHLPIYHALCLMLEEYFFIN